MSIWHIYGGNRLTGSTRVQGAKNAVLPIMAASVLSGGETVLHNVPDLRDVTTTLRILQHLGCTAVRDGDTVRIDSRGMHCDFIPHALMRELRSSVIFLGAILARFGTARLSMPGGCELGPRPVNLHLDALRALGAEVTERGGDIICRAHALQGRRILLPFPSVGATENAMLAACAAAGETVICNAAREPEIADLQCYLRKLGADISGAGTSTVTVSGFRPRPFVEHTIMPDRIVAATILCAAAACGGEVEYDGYKINLRKHRGSRVRKLLMDGENVTDLAVTIDSRENTQSYEISLFKMADLQAGDEVNITYTPMGVNVDTRIISIEYDPFYRYTVRVEVGDYVPNLLASTATQIDRMRQEFKAADGKLLSSIQTVDGNLSTLSQTVSGFNTRIENAEGAVSTLSQTVSSFKTRIENAEGSVSTLTQTVNSFKTRIETAEGNITSVTQTANKINWLVKSGTSASDFTMTDRAIKLVADTIDLSGYVTISALGTAGKTTINGANITTGTIHADRIDTSTLKVKTIYSQSGKVSLKEYTSTTMYIGGDGTWNYDYTYIFAGTQIKLASWDGVGTHALVIDTKNHCVRPATIVDWDLGNISNTFGNIWCEKITIRNGNNDGYIGFNGGTFEIVANGAAVNRLGSSVYYWDTGYISKLYLNSSCYLDAFGSSLRVNGTVIGGADPNMAGKEVKMGGSTGYYITANTSRELKPSSSSTSYPFYLGTASLYWHYAYLGSVQVKIGSGTSSKIGFFAGTPIARQTLSTYSQNMGYSAATSSNYLKILNNLVGILVKYGLIGT